MEIKLCAFCSQPPFQTSSKTVQCQTRDCPEACTDNFTVIETWNKRQERIQEYLEVAIEVGVKSFIDSLNEGY